MHTYDCICEYMTIGLHIYDYIYDYIHMTIHIYICMTVNE